MWGLVRNPEDRFSQNVAHFVCALQELSTKTNFHSLEKFCIQSCSYLISQFITGTQRNVIMFDVDSKDSSVGMSCPPQPFVEQEFLETIKTLVRPGGTLVFFSSLEYSKNPRS